MSMRIVIKVAAASAVLVTVFAGLGSLDSISETPKSAQAAPDSVGIEAASSAPHAHITAAAPYLNKPLRRPGVIETGMDVRTVLHLTVTVAGEQAVTVDGREKQILGSAVVNNGIADELVTFTRDMLSGQVDRWQSAIRFAAKAGVPHEAVLTDYPELTRRFANSQFAEATVSINDMAAIYRRLSTDPRIDSVTLLPIEPVVRPH